MTEDREKVGGAGQARNSSVAGDDAPKGESGGTLYALASGLSAPWRRRNPCLYKQLPPRHSVGFEGRGPGVQGVKYLNE